MPSLYGDRFVCPTCGKRTRVSQRSGLVYSHTRPGSTSMCQESMAWGAAPTVPLTPFDIEAEKESVAEPPRKYHDKLGRSVRTVSGGVPGSKRRH